MEAKKALPTRRFASKVAWEAWLEKHHEVSPGLWLELAKKGSGSKDAKLYRLRLPRAGHAASGRKSTVQPSNGCMPKGALRRPECAR